jgi:hypothetical protein
MSVAARHLRLRGATGAIRTEQFNGRDHLVVPVVMMVEGVVWAVNSDYPELVRAEELAISPQQWNGRPCFAGHPEDGGTQVTANTPQTLEKSFGVLFNTISAAEILETRRLRVEAWLDPEKAVAIGDKEADVIARLQAGEPVEVSGGFYVVVKKETGEFNGKEYVGEWTEIVSDHLAFLAKDEEGACSIAAGCGAPRVAVRHLVTAQGIEKDKEPEMSVPNAAAPTAEQTEQRSVLQRLRSLVTGAFRDASMTDREIRWDLEEKLRAIVPAFMGVDDVNQEEGFVFYSVYLDNDWKNKRRSFTKTNDVLTLGDDEVEVVPKQTYEVVTAAAANGSQPPANPAARAASTCGCTTKKENAMTDRVKNLIAASNGRFTDADASWLSNVPEDHLKTLEAAPGTTSTPPAQPAPTGTPSTPPAQPAPTGTPSTPAGDTPSTPAAPTNASANAAPPVKWEDIAPPHVVKAARREEARAAARKTELVGALKAAASGAYTEAELNGMEVEQLEKLATLAGITVDADEDFGGRGVPLRAAEGSGDVYANPPNGYKVALDKRAGVTPQGTGNASN